MKLVLGIAAITILGIVGYMAYAPHSEVPMNDTPTITDTTTDNTAASSDDHSVVTEGVYVVQAEKSSVTWAGKKPLIEGYINSGSIAVTDGTINVDPTTATGNFTIDMNTLSVSETPTKPGQESSLESHLKGARWFDVETYPDATFTITDVTPRADSDTTFIYDVTGQLTMKGVTDTLSFPARIYQDTDGSLHASADFEFDRTKWGITSGSGSFFDNLADNVIDDMVALSFDLVAEKQ